MAEFIIQGIDASSGQQKNISASDTLVDTDGNTRTGLANKVVNIDSLTQAFALGDLNLVARYTATEDHIEHSGTTLDGSADHWKLPSAVVTAYPFSVSIWFKPNDGQPAAIPVLWSESDEASTAHNWHVRIETNGEASAVSKDSGVVSIAQTTNALDDGASGWHHILAVFASATDREIYLDGDAANSGTNTTSSTPSNLDNTIIGGLESGSGAGDFFGGNIGRVDLWTSAPTSGSTRDDIASNLARGDDPATAFGSSPANTWFDQSTDGTDSAGSDNLSSVGSPTATSECYLLRDRIDTRHLLAIADGPDWSSDALGLGKKGLVFDDTNNEHLAFQGTQVVTSAPFTIWTWFATDTDGAAQALWYLGDSSSQELWRSSARTDLAGDPYEFQTGDGGPFVNVRTSNTLSTNTIHLGTAIEAASNDRTARLDGSGTTTDSTSKSPTTPDTFSIGFHLDSTPGQPLSGAIFELAIIDDSPTTQEETNVENYDLYSDEIPLTVISSSEFENVIINTSLGEANLPSASASQGPINVYVNDANGITLNAASGDTIRVASSVSSTGGSVNSTTQGSFLILVAVDDTQWVAVSEVGTWSTT